MVFNSLAFLVFFLLFFFAYWGLDKRASVAIRNLFILLASYLFYGWWDWRFLGLIALSSLADFIIGLQLGKEERPKARKMLVAFSLLINLGVLGFFKYFNFFAESLQALLTQFSLEVSPLTLSIILPVGISFYTFQTLSYTLDIYNRKLEPTRDFLAFFAFVSFFPQLVAGPIERAQHLLPQFFTQKTFDYDRTVSGLRLVLWGLCKKVVIADNVGVLADSLFDPSASPNGLSVWVGAALFALQIYADFSGYSDMAIGLARMLGFDLKPNFQTPYFASSFREFWQRWHISLSTWFRDYVYIPLGGNRKSSLRVNLNLLITFLLSGLWHGANVTFLIWGGLHGLALVLERRIKIGLPKWLYAPVVLISVILLWIPFRAENATHLAGLVEALISPSSYSLAPVSDVLGHFSFRRFWFLLGFMGLFTTLEYHMQRQDFSDWVGGKRKPIRLTIYYFLLIAILLLGNFSVKPSFIYFQF